jgi:cell fate regulator YaaT (PSP1 superfamily)
MTAVIGVILKKAGKIFYFDPNGVHPAAGDKVVVETGHGAEIGEVVMAAREMNHNEYVLPLKKIMRQATADDIVKYEQNKKKEQDANKVGHDKIRKHNLPMKLVETECLFDGSKLIFYFTAEGRVDFRDLVKDLAAEFKTRIEMRQIGVRDEAKSVGGLGPCGRDLCCRTFLADFEPVSIKMAKEQGLPLNPIKISGVCSRLMCCLKYENDVYVDFRKRAPRIGKPVSTPEGNGTVVGYCAPKDAVTVSLDDLNRYIQVPLSDVGAAEARQPVPVREKPAEPRPRRPRGPRRDKKPTASRKPPSNGTTS